MQELQDFLETYITSREIRETKINCFVAFLEKTYLIFLLKEATFRLLMFYTIKSVNKFFKYLQAQHVGPFKRSILLEYLRPNAPKVFECLNILETSKSYVDF